MSLQVDALASTRTVRISLLPRSLGCCTRLCAMPSRLDQHFRLNGFEGSCQPEFESGDDISLIGARGYDDDGKSGMFQENVRFSKNHA